MLHKANHRKDHKNWMNWLNWMNMKISKISKNNGIGKWVFDKVTTSNNVLELRMSFDVHKTLVGISWTKEKRWSHFAGVLIMNSLSLWKGKCYQIQQQFYIHQVSWFLINQEEKNILPKVEPACTNRSAKSATSGHWRRPALPSGNDAPRRRSCSQW